MSATEHLRGEIETRRATKGLSLNELERNAGLGRGTVSKFLKNADANLSLDVIERLAPVLGATLTELLGARNEVAAPALAGEVARSAEGGSSHVRMLRADQIFPSPLNPRKTTALDAASISDLARSVAANGILQNLTARPRPNPLTETPQVEIVMGERRWRAATHAINEGWLPHDFELPVVVRDLTDAELIELAMIENISRADMSPLEEAEGLAVLHDTARLGGGRDWTARLAKATGKTDRWVQKRVRLARELSDAGKAALAKGEISLQMALELSEVPHAAQGVALENIEKKAWGWDNAEKVQQKLFETLPPASQAIFDMAAYDGGTIEKDGIVKLADPAQAERLQRAAIAAEIERRKAAGETVGEVKQDWQWREARDGEDRTTIVSRYGFAVTFTENMILRASGATLNANAPAEIERQKAEKAARTAARHSFLTQAASALRHNTAARLRLQLRNTMTEEHGFPTPLLIQEDQNKALASALGLTDGAWAEWEGYGYMLTDEMTAEVDAALQDLGERVLERIFIDISVFVAPVKDLSDMFAGDMEADLAAATGIAIPPELIKPTEELEPKPDGDADADQEAGDGV